MARPREFDEGEVLDKALTTFWSRGYEGTSIEDLVQSTGLARASLYGAFGDKRAIFQRVLDHYLVRQAEGLPSPDAAESTRAQLEVLFGTWLGALCPKKGQRGCFLLLTGTSGDSSELAGAALTRSIVRTHKLLRSILERGQARGEVDSARDADAMAHFLGVVQLGLATSARAGMSPHDLSLVATQALDSIAPKRD
jgi:TetR/AcrR family transcriptional repressor of nem operon